MFKMMTTSASAAAHSAAQAVTGLGTAYSTGFFSGPAAAIGFTIGSCIGYILSSLYYFKVTMQHALTAFDQYPKLLLLHMASNYTTYGLEKVSLETEQEVRRFRARLDSSLVLRCLLLSSYHTAVGAIDEITSRKEAALIAKVEQ